MEVRVLQIMYLERGPLAQAAAAQDFKHEVLFAEIVITMLVQHVLALLRQHRSLVTLESRADHCSY